MQHRAFVSIAAVERGCPKNSSDRLAIHGCINFRMTTTKTSAKRRKFTIFLPNIAILVSNAHQPPGVSDV